MRILYSAIDQVVPGTKGGSVHVTAVAEGLAALGHDVHVLVTRGAGPFPSGAVTWIEMAPPFGASQLRWARSGAAGSIAAALRPDVIMERYYNFGGEAILHARRLGALAVLEVNAPVVDHPGSTKALLDRALLVRPMQRWRERLCDAADLIVTPSAAILPPGTPAQKILEVEWGADTDRFRPGAAGPLPFTPPRGVVAVFAGAFRNWHGAVHLARTMRQLRERGRDGMGALFIGEGPELPNVRAEAAGLDNVVFTGALPHAVMPAALASAHIGVAPFDIAAHKPLALGFYWSPLKMFEYMAAGLPVVAPRVARIPQLVEHDREGLLYDAAQPAALADALERLSDPALRQRLGTAARARAEREYSWRAHCGALDRAFRARSVNG
ncbi:MAG TPA: glycosyltransferase family 4 protein [Vicinamibacterales bacterium]|nr:glycosyltransferase family 4 protein [Vicinamibacterales bacterium]